MQSRDGKRRLPVLRSASGTEDDPPRASWQWVAFGALAIVTIWIPAAAIAGAFGTRVATRALAEGGRRGVEGGLWLAGSYALAFALGALAGGYLIGRWGSAGTGAREAALAGLAAASAAIAVSWLSLGPTPGAVVLALLAVPAAAAGGVLGLRRRARAG